VVNGDNWWFGAQGTIQPSASFTVVKQLFKRNINIIALFWNGAGVNEFPIDSGREEDNDTIRDVESDNYTAAHYGIREMCGCIP
jgi:hypothetical protein